MKPDRVSSPALARRLGARLSAWSWAGALLATLGLLVVIDPETSIGARAQAARSLPEPREIHGLELVAHLPIPHGSEEVNSDVWKLGNTAMIGYRCNGSGSALIDVTEPQTPTIVFRTPSIATLFANDVKALRLEGPAYTGDVFIEPHDQCGATNTPARTRFWNIDDPARPRLLSELVTYSGVHNAYPYVRDGRAYLLLALPRGDTASQGVRGGFGIVEFTDPTRPALVGIYNLRRDLGDVPGTDFLHDVWASRDGRTAYLAWWDAGVILLDISETERPRRIGRVEYYATREWYGLAAGNTHAVVPLENPRFIVVTDEDFTIGPSDPWGFTRIFDLQAPGGPRQSAVITTANTLRYPARDRGWYSVHNPMVQGNLVYLAHYSDGVRVWNAANPYAPEEVAWFVPPDLPDRRGRSLKTLIWGVYPEGDLVYASDISHGLWILRLPDDLVPPPSATPTAGRDITATPSVTATVTAAVTATLTLSPTPDVTETVTPTPEPTATDVLAPTATDSPAPSDTPTATAAPPTATESPEATEPGATPTEEPGTLPPCDHCQTPLYLPAVLSRSVSAGRLSSRLPEVSALRPGSTGAEPDLTVSPGLTVSLGGEQRFRNVVIADGGTLQVQPYSGVAGQGRLDLYASRITVEQGGKISADGAGWRGRQEAEGEGPGGGAGGSASLLLGLRHFTGAGAGGAYGGRGGDGMLDEPRGQWKGGRPYGTAYGPDLELGSAGGAAPPSHHEIASLAGGNGGGVIRLVARQVAIHGEVTSRGSPGPAAEYDASGGGAGGALAIEAVRLDVSGLVSVAGGLGGKGWEDGGAGGGGRIKLRYARGGVDPHSLDAEPGAGPCPGDESSKLGCAGSIHIERLPAPVYLPALVARVCVTPSRVALVVALDVSTSMLEPAVSGGGPSRLEVARRAVAELAAVLSAADRIGLVAYSGAASVVVPLTHARGEVLMALERLEVTEGSRLDEGLATAEAALGLAWPAEERIVVVVTDGIGQAPEAPQVAAHLRRQGVRIRAVATGGLAATDQRLLGDVTGGAPPVTAAVAGLPSGAALAIAGPDTCPRPGP